jgi:hypothetical protein
MRMPEEDFAWIADTIDLRGRDREALRLQVVQGMDIRSIARELRIKVRRVRESLAATEERIRAYPWPKGERAWLRMLLETMRGPRNPNPQAPLVGWNTHAGRYEATALRTRYPNEWDFMPVPPDNADL